MERPTSSASSHAGHKHTLSTSLKAINANGTATGTPVLMQDTSAAALFVNNLRLLDFDLLPDWPGITSTTFGNNDARARIRGTEFALYQLFRFYDPMTTSEKLQPFFPPLEPLQSINLRAALYRCLNELKKNGVLGRDVTLRKSMLDECQGDKFLELCLSFSATVLRKMTLARTASRPCAEQIGLAQYISRDDAESMLPLAVAHKVVLTKMLRQRQKKHETYVNLYNVLIQKEAELQQRKAHAQENTRKRPFLAGIDNIDAVERVALQNQPDNDVLYNAIINGDDLTSGDSLLTRDFEVIWSDNAREVPSQNHATDGYLEGLKGRATQQTQRLQKWRRTHEKLVSDQACDTKRRAPQTTPVTAVAHFDQHRQINVRDGPTTFTYLSSGDAGPKAGRYDEILTAMREELRRNRHRIAPSGPTTAQAMPTVPVRKASITIDLPLTNQTREARPASQTAVPVRPNMFGRRVPSRSRSYQQPKVDSQRQPIPFKSEIFSPMKTQRNSVSPTFTSTSVLPSPAESVELADSSMSESSTSTSPSISGRSNLIGNVAGEHADSYSPIDYEPSSAHTRTSSVSGPLANISLAERTRMSLAQSQTERRVNKSISLDIDELNGYELRGADEGIDERLDVDSPTTRPSLAERTRQSLLLAPMPSSRPTSTHESLARTPKYPINAFETPTKTRGDNAVGIVGDAPTPICRNVTPRERLFSPEAEYNSVFKARPKIALSPVITAQKRPDSGCVSLDLSDASPHRVTAEV